MTRIGRILTDKIIKIRFHPFHPRHPRTWFFNVSNILTIVLLFCKHIIDCENNCHTIMIRFFSRETAKMMVKQGTNLFHLTKLFLTFVPQKENTRYGKTV